MNRKAWKLLRLTSMLAFGYCYAVACIPEGAIREVAAENIVRTVTLFTSTIVSFLFLNFFPTL